MELSGMFELEMEEFNKKTELPLMRFGKNHINSFIIPISLNMCSFLLVKITNYCVIYLIVRTTSY